MNMRRPILVVLLTLGTIGGYAAGFAHLRCASSRQQAFEQHVAKVCVDAARSDRDPGWRGDPSPR